MKKSIIFLTIMSLITSQVRPCSPAVAVAGTALVGAVATANVYRVYSQSVKPYKYYYFSHETRKNCAIGLGLVATVGVGCMLHQATPMARLARATKLLTKVEANPLLQSHHLVKTPDFPSEVQRRYVSSGLPYAQAFKDLKESKIHSNEAIDLIGKARNIETSPKFGQEVLDASIKNNDRLDDLMLAVKAQPTFESEYVGYNKIKTDKEIADSADTIATAQVIQTINSFSHRR